MKTSPRFIGWQDTSSGHYSRPTRTSLFNVPLDDASGETTLTYQTLFRANGDRWQFSGAACVVRITDRKKWFLCELPNGYYWSDTPRGIWVFPAECPKSIAHVLECIRKSKAMAESRIVDAWRELHENGYDAHARFKDSLGKKWIAKNAMAVFNDPEDIHCPSRNQGEGD